jgi:glycosyltransferase involved in cell wall biosynthesis
MEKISFSVIVPIYGTEKYVRRCIASIINQTYKNFELIIINDCTIDNSIEIIQENFSDKRIKYINNSKNVGLGESRNVGIHSSKGDYLIFVDSDDFVEPDMLEQIEKRICDERPEAIRYGNYNYYNGKKDLYTPNRDLVKGGFSQSLIQHIIGSGTENLFRPKLGFTPWGWALKKSFILEHSLLFRSEREILFEDLVFAFDVANVLSSLEVVDLPLYHYEVREESLSNYFSMAKGEKFERMIFFIEREFSQVLKKSTNREQYFNTLLGYFLFFSQKSKSREEVIYLSELYNNLFEPSCIGDYPLKLRCYFSLLTRKRVIPLLCINHIKETINKVRKYASQ